MSKHLRSAHVPHANVRCLSVRCLSSVRRADGSPIAYSALPAVDWSPLSSLPMAGNRGVELKGKPVAFCLICRECRFRPPPRPQNDKPAVLPDSQVRHHRR